MNEPTTTQRLSECYNTLTRRPTVLDPRTRAVVFKTFQRTLGPWLPADRQARLNHLLGGRCGGRAAGRRGVEQCRNAGRACSSSAIAMSLA